MITCICDNVSNKKIIEIVKVFPTIETLKQLKAHINICSQCGKCKHEVKNIIHSCHEHHTSNDLGEASSDTVKGIQKSTAKRRI